MLLLKPHPLSIIAIANLSFTIHNASIKTRDMQRNIFDYVNLQYIMLLLKQI